MRKTETEALWEALERDASDRSRSGYLIRRATANCGVDLYLAIKYPERQRALILRIPSAAIPNLRTLPETRGLHVFAGPLADDAPGTASLVVELRDTGFAETFDTFAGILVGRVCACAAAKEAAAELVFQLLRWQRFLDAATDGLGDEAQRGLYGELHVLRSLIAATKIPHLAARWAGPSGSPQDFRFVGGVAVEVKTSISREPQSIKITGERQLDDSNLSSLFLISISIESLTGDGESLPQLVRAVRDLLAGHPTEEAVFEDALLEAGYLVAHEGRYAARGYRIRNERCYRVRDGFPRITEADLREGVGYVEYRISLAGCMPFAVTLAEIAASVASREAGSDSEGR